MKKFEMRKTVLPNGVRIVTEKDEDSKNVTCFFHYSVGSRNELSTEKGIAHFLEHMIFKGSNKINGQEMLKRLAILGDANASTGEEETMYHFKTPIFNLETMTDTFCEILTNPSFNQDEIDTERHTVVQEILLYESDLCDVTDNLAKKSFFNGHPLSSPIVGDIDTIMNMETSDFKSFHNRNYNNPLEIVIVATGGVDHDEFVSMIEPYYGKLRPLSITLIDGIPVTSNWIEFLERESDQTYLSMVLNGPSQSEKDPFTEQMVCNMLGGPWLSRLFRKIRVDKGMSYGVNFSMHPFSDCGITDFSVATEYPIECLEIACKEMSELMKIGYADEELTQARDMTLTAYNMSCNSSAFRIARILANELYDRPYRGYDEVVECFNNVSMPDVMGYVNKYWKDSPITCVGVGKAFDTSKAMKIINSELR